MSRAIIRSLCQRKVQEFKRMLMKVEVKSSTEQGIVHYYMYNRCMYLHMYMHIHQSTHISPSMILILLYNIHVVSSLLPYPSQISLQRKTNVPRNTFWLKRNLEIKVLVIQPREYFHCYHQSAVIILTSTTQRIGDLNRLSHIGVGNTRSHESSDNVGVGPCSHSGHAKVNHEKSRAHVHFCWMFGSACVHRVRCVTHK